MAVECGGLSPVRLGSNGVMTRNGMTSLMLLTLTDTMIMRMIALAHLPLM